MKTIRIIITVLFLLLVASILGNIVISTLGLFFGKDIINYGIIVDPSFWMQLIFLFKAIALLIFVYATFKLIINLKLFSKGDFFDAYLVRFFRKTGRLFCVSGSIGLLATFAEVFVIVKVPDFHSQIYLNIDSKSLYIMLLILGLFFILFSKVLNRGSQIQQENDLTI